MWKTQDFKESLQPLQKSLIFSKNVFTFVAETKKYQHVTDTSVYSDTGEGVYCISCSLLFAEDQQSHCKLL